MRAKPKARPGDGTLIAVDPRMAEIVQLIERLGNANSNVLLSGESGTGKDLLVHGLHFWGERNAHPLTKVDLASLPATLIESELFGYERGAFTGATTSKPGRLELSGQGTLFLDHVGELSPALQAKLLRVVEERRFERLGGTQAIALEARIVATASDDVEQAVAREHFRRDLFHRLGVFWIRLPPLRERPDDVMPLARAFLEHEIGWRSLAPLSFSDDVVELFETYHWPGNVRELKAAVEYATLVATGPQITRVDLPSHLLDVSEISSRPGKRPTLAEMERRYIAQVLKDVGGNQTRAAQALGISRKSLWERRRKFGLDGPREEG